MSTPVPAVRLVISDEKGRVLLLRRAGSEHATGSWCLPGGKVGYCETVDLSVRKELEEETGLTLVSSRFLFFQDSLPPEPGQMHCINLYFECKVAGEVTLNEESSEYAWVGPTDLKGYDIVFRNDLGVLSYWEEEGNLVPEAKK